LLFVQPFFLFVLLPGAVCLFYIMRSFAGQTAALAVIVAASAIFYAPFGGLAATLLATSLCLNLIIGITLSSGSDGDRWHHKIWLAIGLGLNFAALATFKYLDQLAALVVPSAGPILGIAIPAGISFYTFHQAVFLLDAHKRQTEVVNFLTGANSILGGSAALIRYAAFVAFFPQLVIGPITYMSEFAPQVLRQGFGRLRIVNIQVGLTLVVAGLFKKLVIADILALVVNPIFENVAVGTAITSSQALLAIIGYFFQLYFDFSGYSDIALGIARLFGLRLPINFDSPLRATGIVDFYRRWHMTLTRVIVLFVFTPLSLWGTRVAVERGYKGWPRRALSAWMPFLVNFQLIALWHSAKYTFVVFGLVHGLWCVVETEIRGGRSFKSFRSRTSDRFRMIAGMAITIIPLTLTFALFRSVSLVAFWNLLTALLGISPSPAKDVYINPRKWLIIAVVAFIVYTLPNIYEVLKFYRPGIVTFDNKSMTAPIFQVTWRPNLVWGLAIAMLALLAFARLNQATPFLYAGF
jgi:alginate O-acetyltransferase complex protein AlgI